MHDKAVHMSILSHNLVHSKIHRPMKVSLQYHKPLLDILSLLSLFDILHVCNQQNGTIL